MKKLTRPERELYYLLLKTGRITKTDLHDFFYFKHCAEELMEALKKKKTVSN